MSKNVSELCALLVEDIYGALPYQIINVLLQYGRSSLDYIQQHLPTLSRYEVKAVVAVLIQHNLVLQSPLSDQNQASYEAHVANIYNLVRLGKFVRLVDGRLGKFAGQAVATLQSLGFAKIRHILDSFESVQQQLDLPRHTQNGVKPALPNGAQTEAVSMSTLNKYTEEPMDTIKNLLHHGLLETLRDQKQLITVTDVRAEADTALENKGAKQGILGGRAKVAYDETVMNQMKSWRIQYSQPTAKGNNLKSEDSVADIRENPNKRRKMNNGVTEKVNGYHSRHILGDSDEEIENSPDLDTNLTLRMANDKLNVVLRSEQFVQASARCLGEPTSKVYDAFLKCAENRIDRCFDEYEDNDGRMQTKISVTLQTFQVAAMLSTSVNLKSSLGPRYRSEAPDVDPDCPSSNASGMKRLKSDAQLRQSDIEQHLHLLAEHPFGFVTHLQSPEPSIPDTWSVDFSKITHNLIQQSLEGIITARFGMHAKRVVRILHSQGKLDERRLAQVSFLRPKDLRAILCAMQVAGFVNTQEVPKDSTRQPRSTIFLWFYDAERARQIVLEDTYKAMARLIQRGKVERERVRSVLEKVTRSDVKGHEELYLSIAEKEALANWKSKEEMLLVQLGRQDDLVALLRDFLPVRILQGH